MDGVLYGAIETVKEFEILRQEAKHGVLVGDRSAIRPLRQKCASLRILRQRRLLKPLRRSLVGAPGRSMPTVRSRFGQTIAARALSCCARWPAKWGGDGSPWGRSRRRRSPAAPPEA